MVIIKMANPLAPCFPETQPTVLQVLAAEQSIQESLKFFPNSQERMVCEKGLGPFCDTLALPSELSYSRLARQHKLHIDFSLSYCTLAYVDTGSSGRGRATYTAQELCVNATTTLSPPASLQEGFTSLGRRRVL